MTELIQAASIARVTSKTGKFLGFLVKSNHTEDYYQVTCLKIDGICVWSCTCYSGQHGFVNCQKYGHCCHVEAVIEVSQARKELAKEAAPVAEPIMAQIDGTLAGLPVIHPALEVYAEREISIARPAKIEAPEYRWCPPGYVKSVALSIDTPAFPKAKSATCKRAPQFSGRGFVVAPITELGGRMVPLKVA